jgi:hypothetical protein
MWDHFFIKEDFQDGPSCTLSHVTSFKTDPECDTVTAFALVSGEHLSMTLQPKESHNMTAGGSQTGPSLIYLPGQNNGLVQRIFGTELSNSILQKQSI